MTFDARQPFTEILTYAKELKASGASNRVVNNFIFDSYLELIKEVEMIRSENLIKEIDLNDILGGVSKVGERFFSAAADTVKAKLAGVVLNSLGIQEGYLRQVVINFIKNTDMKDIMAYVRGSSTEICSTLSTDLATSLVEAIVDEVLNSENIGLDTDGWMYLYLKNVVFMSGETDEGLQGILKRWLEKNVCGAFGKWWDDLDLFQENNIKIATNTRAKQEINKEMNETFQRRMKKRLRRQMKTLLDGGRKDLVKYGKPWNKGRQSHSNAFAANEAMSMGGGNVAGAVAKVDEIVPQKKTKSKTKSKKKKKR